MTDSINNGGPAFPTVAGQTVYSHGMWLRDYFAGQIIGALIACPEDEFAIFAEEHGTGSVTKLSYAIADKMMEARK